MILRAFLSLFNKVFCVGWAFFQLLVCLCVCLLLLLLFAFVADLNPFFFLRFMADFYPFVYVIVADFDPFD